METIETHFVLLIHIVQILKRWNFNIATNHILRINYAFISMHTTIMPIFSTLIHRYLFNLIFLIHRYLFIQEGIK